MRVLKRAVYRRTRGKILVLTALLLPMILGFMALSVDVAAITAARAQLKTVSDAAALSGAMKLADDSRTLPNPNMTSIIAAAQTLSKTIAQDNRVLTATPIIVDNPGNSASGDIVAGYVNPSSHAWSPPPLANILTTNSIRVNAERSINRGGQVPGFFSRIWGSGGSIVSVQSIATAWNYPVMGFKPAGSTPGNSSNANLLPIVLDVNTYNLMMARQTTDQYTFTPANYHPPNSNGVTDGADGVFESVLYPVSSGNSGNWGTINVGVSNNGTGTLAAQIQDGITPAQLATFPNSTIALDRTQSPPQITFGGNPGISAGIKSALDSIIGKPVIIPIYDQSGGNGNNAWYRVVAFQPCRIMAVSFQGNPKYVIIQPALIKDPTAIPVTNPANWPAGWSWQSGGLVRAYLTN
jgi:Flp pilus assembly protein TadG